MIRSTVTFAAGLALALAFGVSESPGLGAQQPGALLAQVRGNVSILRGDPPTEMEARMGLRLEIGDRLQVARGSRAVLLMSDGRLVTTSSSLTIEEGAGAGAPVLRQTAAGAARVAEAPPPPEPDSGVARPIGGAARPVSPGRNLTVMEVRPTFAWRGPVGAEGYTLQISSPEGGVARRFQVGPDTSWTLPSDEIPLIPGRTYNWTVVAVGTGRVTEQARFRVVDTQGWSAVQDFIGVLRESGVDPESDGLFLLAVFFNEQGLVYEAEAAIKALEAADDQPRGPVFHLLKASVYERLGRFEEANRAYEQSGVGG